LESIGAGRWADCVDEELKDHVAGCAECSEIATVAFALVEDRRAAVREAAVPSSGLVWWRMQMRARREEQRAAGRTVSLTHAVVLCCATVVALATLGGILLPDPGAWVARFGTMFSAHALDVTNLPFSWIWVASLLLAAAAWLVLAPVAVWFAIKSES